MKQTVFTVRGILGPLPAAIWGDGRSRFSYVEVGDTRIDSCWVEDYIVSSLERAVGGEVELSFFRIHKRAVHLAAIKSNGKVERIPDQSPFLFKEMVVAALVWGAVTFISSWFIAPALFVIPALAAKSVLLGFGEKVLTALVFLGFASIWAAQLLWVLFYSKKLSPKKRLKTVTAARTAFD